MRQIVLLRGINLGPRNRIAMPELRSRLAESGYEDVRTYVQSGNLVLSSEAEPDALAREIEHEISAGFGLQIAAVARTRDELAAVVRRNPLGAVAVNPKRYQVSFLSGELEPAVLEKLQQLAVKPEQFVAHERELYAWHPEGVARSRLWAELARIKGDVVATARNWTTVTTLLEMAEK